MKCFNIEQHIKWFTNEEIKDYKLIDNSRSEKEIRLIFIITLKSEKKIVVKAYSDTITTIEKIQAWSKLAKDYKENKIKTADFLPRQDLGGYGVNVIDNDMEYCIWAEEYMSQPSLDAVGNNGYEGTDISFLNDIGSMVGRMCSVSKKSNVRFGWNGPYILFEKPYEDDENYTNALRLYNGLSGNNNINNELNQFIWETYNEKREKLKSFYAFLPSGAIQCDLSENNILVNEDENLSGIIDYNISGDDHYIAYAIQEFIFIAFEAYKEEWLDREHCLYMEERFKALYKGFFGEYCLSHLESESINLLYNICRPFRFDKVIITLRKANEGLYKEVNDRLDWMLRELTRTNISEFINN